MLSFAEKFFTLGLALIFFCSPFSPRESWGGDGIGKYEKKAEKIREEIQRERQKAQKLSKREETILEILGRTERDLDRAGKQSAAIEKELTVINDKIDTLEKRSEELSARVKENESYAGRRLTALYKLERLGKIQLLASADSIGNYLLRKTALEKILENDDTTLSRLQEDKKRLEEVLTRLRLKKAEKTELHNLKAERIKEMASRRKDKNWLLHTIQKQKTLSEDALKSLEEDSRKLEQKISALLAAAEKAKKKQESHSFAGYKGDLNLPVKGVVITRFGPYKDKRFNVMNFRSGIDIRAVRGEPIHAVRKGTILFASWFKGYGNMMIIDHGDNYYTLYAHAQEFFRSKGERVETGEVIGTVGDTGSMEGAKLHFQVRHHGKPVDPIKWLKNG